MKRATLTFVAAIALAGCCGNSEVRDREHVGSVEPISAMCGPKQQLLNEDVGSLVFVQIVNNQYALYYRGNSEGMKEINCAFPFKIGELEGWLTANKVPYSKYMLDGR